MGRLVREELHQRVRSALDDLAPAEREVVVMRHLEELSLAEVGEVLGISVEAARSRYRRAIEHLHGLLDDGSEGGR
jgi:RNA polymerase sigma-70 factor (ECF subfamily)